MTPPGETNTEALPVTQRSPGYTTKVETQPTFPPLDLPDTSQLPSHSTPQPWGSCFKQYE